MKYFLDTEFHEYKKKPLLGKAIDTIDLISIGIVCEDGREYYAISKDFNLKEAWNRWQQRTGEGDRNNTEPRLYWLRDNVLKPIYVDLFNIEHKGRGIKYQIESYKFTYKELKRLLNKYGKTNKQIAEEVRQFCLPTKGFLRDNYELKNGIFDKSWDFTKMNTYEKQFNKEYKSSKHPEFYAYYADYDWVAFCWLFGRMIDLPNGFPMYCIDLKQTMDEKENNKTLMIDIATIPNNMVIYDYIAKYYKFKSLKEHPNYPKQTNEHNALADAKFNYELYKFLNTI